jgi:hypothetical protein
MKKAPGHHKTETAGLLAIQTVAHEWGWIWRPTSAHDTGIDGVLEILEGAGAVTGKQLAVQSKAGRSYLKNETDSTFEFHARADDVEYWADYSLPVILAVYDPTLRQLYGISVKDYLRDKPDARSAPHRFVFHKDTDLLGGDAHLWMRGIAFCGTRTYTARVAGAITETLHTNLLSVLSTPTVIHCSSPLGGKERRDIPRGSVVIEKESRWWSFDDPVKAGGALRQFVDDGSVDTFRIEEMVEHEDRRRYVVELFNKVLRGHLYGLPIAFDRAHGRYYFLPKNAESRSWDYQSVKRKASRKVAHPLSGKNWAHHAVKFGWELFGTRWFLKVVPAYVFTEHGARVLADEDVVRLNVKKRKREYNRQVFQHLIFWREVLSRGAHQISIPTGDEPVLIDKNYVCQQASFGIPDDRATIAAIAAPAEEALHEDDFDTEDDIDVPQDANDEA